jgi:hypothetical protein
MLWRQMCKHLGDSCELFVINLAVGRVFPHLSQGKLSRGVGEIDTLLLS